MSMKLLIITIIATAAFASARPEFEEELTMPETELISVEPTTMFLEAKATVSAMQKKGATEADCKDLAKTSCKEVESEVNTDQKSLDKLQSGAQCDNLGQTQVRKATTEHTRTVTEHNKAKVNVKTSYNARVNFGSHRFSSLKVGECGVFFGSRSYLTAKATYEKHVRIEVSWRGRVKESLKTKTNAIEAAKRQVYHCRCSTKHTRDTLWKTVSTASRRNRQVKAHAKCKMMSCVLNGTNLSSSKCKSNLKRLVNKRLSSATESANCKVHHAHVREVKAKAVAREKDNKHEKFRKEKERLGKANEKADKDRRKKEKAAKEVATKKAEKANKVAKEKNAKAKAAAKKKKQEKEKAARAAKAATKAAKAKAAQLKAEKCRTRTWRTNRWYAWTDCCRGCDGRAPAPGGMRGSCIHRQKYNWGKDASECTCRATPSGTTDFKTNTYYANVDCCQGCRAAGSTCVARHKGFAWTSVCTCRMSC